MTAGTAFSSRADVVVVGGGIAGASLAFALAREGVGVTVLEATVEFVDRVRGESMQAWGVLEARQLGVEDLLMTAGAHITPTWRQYFPSGDDPRDIAMNRLVPDIGGSLNLRHPIACQFLLDAAAGVGAAVVRGVSEVGVAAGSSPSVKYAVNGESAVLRPSLVVGADGRRSVTRRDLGITLRRQAETSYIAGLLLDGLDTVPDDHDVLIGEGDRFFLLFHQGDGRARAYVCTGLSGRHRFAGPDGAARFLEACAVSSYPWCEQVVAATPAGPCATYPGDDTWCAEPYVDGAVLIGDAAGYNDPIIGQGLSIAMRDARTVRDLVLEGARTADSFAAYGAERMARMTRLRFAADLIAATYAEDANNRDARRRYLNERMANMDAAILPLVLGVFSGPESIGDELLDPGVLDSIRAA
jgi:2-polyprenyl-6-methoxyphenol hydroxylase-like FAD-dependent oxidoreductase